jgi:hypothetical protein
MNQESIIRVKIEAPTLADLRAFADELKPDLGCRATPRRKDGRFSIDAYLPETQLEGARRSRAANRVTIRVLENATAVGHERQKEVGQINRFSVRGQVPRGLGRKE